MIVQVASEVRLVSDGTSWTVQRRLGINKKTGEYDWSTLGYYGWMSQAAKAVLERHVQLLDGKSNEVDLATFVDLVLTATAQIEDACERLAKQVVSGQLMPAMMPRVSEKLAQTVKP